MRERHEQPTTHEGRSVDRRALRNTLNVWVHREENSREGLAYVLYCAVLLAIIVAAPLVRAAFMGLTMPEALAVIGSPQFGSYSVDASVALLAVACAPWAMPVARREVLAGVLSAAPFRYSRAFAKPVWVWWITVAACALTVTAIVQAALLSTGGTTIEQLITTITNAMAWATFAVAVAVVAQRSLGAGITMSLVFAASAIVVWATGSGALLGSFVAATLVAVVALVVAVMVPRAINSLPPAAIIAASGRRDAMVLGVQLMEVHTVSNAVADLPTTGRRLRAATRLPIWLALPYAAAIGSLRTPARLIRAAGVMLAAAAVAGMATSVWVGVGAALLMFAGLGALTDGVRLAADSARTPAAFGVSDLTLVAAHTVYPLTAVLVIGAVGGAVGGPAGWLAAALCGIAGVIARVLAALAPDMPIDLLMPVPTPAGDMAALLRLAWSLQGYLAAGALGYAVITLLDGNMTAGALAAVAAAAALTVRWRSR